MPTVAIWIDSLRDAFGKAEIDQRIRQGMKGEPGAFYAAENGNTVGTPARPARVEFNMNEIVIESQTRKPDNATRR
jgi:hypothetical protein